MGQSGIHSTSENLHRQPLLNSTAPLPEMSGFPLVSVIIPVYNVEKYLGDCLDSITNQTLKNIEILCIDDGSSDASPQILQAYAEKDPRIRIITQQNAGVAAARNSGLAAAKGEYIYCLDSDDVLAADALESACRVSLANRLDILYFDFIRFGEDGSVVKKMERKDLSYIYDGVTFCRTLKDRREYLGVVWTQLYRRAYLVEKGLSFHPGIIHEDELFVFRALLDAQRVSHIPCKFYRYRLRENSIMSAKKSAENVIGYFTCLKEMLAYGLREKHSAEKSAEILRAVLAMQEKAKQYYGWIDNDEKIKLSFDDPISVLLFEKLVLEMDGAAFSAGVGGQDAQVLSLINRTLTQELEDTRSSASYRIGRFITWLPRKLNGFILCWKMHGPGYTWERITAHFRREE